MLSSLCRVEANKFTDWTREEFEALILPNRHSPIEHPTLQSMQKQGASVRVHEPRLTKGMLPSTVDWRGTPADSPVKDQAACGSCWVSPEPYNFPFHCMPQEQGAIMRVYASGLSEIMLPSMVDWRETPADSPVKDQAACGSC